MTTVIENMLDFETDLNETIQSVAVLVRFVASQWSGLKRDDIATDLVREGASAQGRIGNFNKNLLGDFDAELKALKSVIGAARNRHYAMTYPFGNSSGRLLPNARFEEYIRTMAGFRNDVAARREQFAAVYPSRVRQAIATHGSLGREEDYPPAEAIASQFWVKFEVEPVPSSRGGFHMEPTFVAKLESEMRKRTEASIREALTTGFQRLREHVEVIERQMSPSESESGRRHPIHKTVLENALKSVALVRPFNILGDPEVNALLDEIEYRLCDYSIDDLKKHEDVRSAAHVEAQNVLDKMTALGL